VPAVRVAQAQIAPFRAAVLHLEKPRKAQASSYLINVMKICAARSAIGWYLGSGRGILNYTVDSGGPPGLPMRDRRPGFASQGVGARAPVFLAVIRCADAIHGNNSPVTVVLLTN